MSSYPILLAAHPTVGHTSALRAMGVRLAKLGHPVAMSLVDAKLPAPSLWPAALRAAGELQGAVARDGIAVFPLPPPLRMIWYATQIARKTGLDELEVAIKLFTTDIVRQARCIAAHAEQHEARVIVADYLMPAALLAAQLADVPVAAIYHSALPFPMDGAAPFGSGLSENDRGTPQWLAAETRLEQLFGVFDRRVGQAARALDITWQGSLLRPVSPDLNILLTTPALEPGLGEFDEPVVMTGPCLPEPSSTNADHPALAVLPKSGRRVYVSLGTVFSDKPQVYGVILDALARTEAHVVVSAGASRAQLERLAGPNVHIFDRVPQVALLEQVDLVITHGGNNTVQESLAAGCSMVVIPFGGDQIANSQRVERLGVGLAIAPTQLTVEKLAGILERLQEPQYTRRAAELGRGLSGLDGTARATESILDLASRSRP